MPGGETITTINITTTTTIITNSITIIAITTTTTTIRRGLYSLTIQPPFTPRRALLSR